MQAKFALALLGGAAAQPATHATPRVPWATSLASDTPNGEHLTPSVQGRPCLMDHSSDHRHCQDDEPHDVAVDAAGNSVVVGVYRGVMRLSGGTSNLISSGNHTNCFVAVVSPAGVVLQATSFAPFKDVGVASAHNDAPRCNLKAVAVTSTGDIVVGGWFAGSMVLGATSLTYAQNLGSGGWVYYHPGGFGFVAVLDSALRVLRATTGPFVHPSVPHTGSQTHVTSLAALTNGDVVVAQGEWLIVVSTTTLVVQHSLKITSPGDQVLDGITIGGPSASGLKLAADGSRVAVVATVRRGAGAGTYTFGSATISVTHFSQQSIVGVVDTNLSPSSAILAQCVPDQGSSQSQSSFEGAVAIDAQTGNVVHAFSLVANCTYGDQKVSVGEDPYYTGSDYGSLNYGSAVVMLTPLLTPVWASTFGLCHGRTCTRTLSEGWLGLGGVASSSSRLVATGMIVGTSSFGSTTLTANASMSTGYVAHLDPASGAIVSALQFHAPEGAQGVAVSSSGTATVMVGTYRGDTVLFGAATPLTLAQSSGTHETYTYSYSYDDIGVSRYPDGVRYASGSFVAKLVVPNLGPSPPSLPPSPGAPPPWWDDGQASSSRLHLPSADAMILFGSGADKCALRARAPSGNLSGQSGGRVLESNCEMVTPSSAGGSARRLLGASVDVDFERLVTDLREEKAALEQRLAAMERSWALMERRLGAVEAKCAGG